MASNSTRRTMARKPGEVVARDRALGRVVDGLDTGHDPESAEEERECRAEPGAQPRVGPRGEDEHGQRDEAADEVVARRRPRLRLEEVVVRDVERDDPERRASHDGLGQDAGASPVLQPDRVMRGG